MQCIKAFIIEQVKKTCQIKADLGKNFIRSRGKNNGQLRLIMNNNSLGVFTNS